MERFGCLVSVQGLKRTANQTVEDLAGPFHDLSLTKCSTRIPSDTQYDNVVILGGDSENVGTIRGLRAVPAH